MFVTYNQQNIKHTKYFEQNTSLHADERSCFMVVYTSFEDKAQ